MSNILIYDQSLSDQYTRSEKYSFENWRLAFEVEIKIVEHEKLDGVSAAWNARFEDSFVFKQHGKATDRTLKHIYLDFKSKSFVASVV